MGRSTGEAPVKLREPGEAGTSSPIPCFQCGVCCERWQPLLDPAEVRRVASDLGMTARRFSGRYTRPYPVRRGYRQVIANQRGACIFLKDAACSIYEQRPQICRDWQAGLDKRECLEGMRRMNLALPELVEGRRHD